MEQVTERQALQRIMQKTSPYEYWVEGKWVCGGCDRDSRIDSDSIEHDEDCVHMIAKEALGLNDD